MAHQHASGIKPEWLQHEVAALGCSIRLRGKEQAFTGKSANTPEKEGERKSV